jgi:arylsulfatase A-like enzyme
MRALALLLVLVGVKMAALAGHHVVLSWWSPIAYFWQDALVVLAFAVVDAGLERRRRGAIAWLVYASLAGYAVINLPVTRVLATPLTWSMLRAARGPLADSIRFYVTAPTLVLVGSAIMVAVVAPFLLRRAPERVVIPMLALWAALGPAAVARVDTQGLERNAWTTLAITAMPRVSPRASAADWRAEGIDRTRRDDLTAFRGTAAGRNVVLVSLESTAAQYLALYGAEPDVVPNLSALARRAVVFDNAYAVYPESIKGLFSILCAASPAFDRAAEAYAEVPCQSIATVLRQNGYRTALVHSGRFAYLGMEAIVGRRGYDTLADAGDIGGHRESSFGVDEPSTVAYVLQWIDALPAGRPFFLTYLPIAGHHPYDAPKPGPFSERDDFGRYRNALRYGDESLGTLMRGIADRGLDERTLWVVFGDHGEAFGQHDNNYGHTFRLYEENVHVPFVVAAPGLFRSQLRSRQIVSLIDTAPTILDLIGIHPPAAYQGRSALDGEARIAFFFSDYSLALVGLRDGPFKFIHELGSGRSRMFDVERDPREQTDLAASHPELVHRYVRNVRGWSAAEKQRLNAATGTSSGRRTPRGTSP